MTYYHKTKEDALRVGAELAAADENIASFKAELEPFNGWVIVLTPMVANIAKYADVAELRHPAGHRLLYGKPPTKRRPPPPAKKREKVEAVYKPVPKVDLGEVPW